MKIRPSWAFPLGVCQGLKNMVLLVYEKVHLLYCYNLSCVKGAFTVLL